MDPEAITKSLDGYLSGNVTTHVPHVGMPLAPIVLPALLSIFGERAGTSNA
ncbi:MAG: hypothetical protein ACR2HH_10135 [Chthoniobacterales bacterium]